MIGRRVATIQEVTRPGDYCGPTDEINHEGEIIGWGVWFLLPIADPVDPLRRDMSSREAWLATRANGMHRVTSRLWTLRECPDGSLEIRPSIACGRHEPDAGEYWHGYLDEGHSWRWD